MINQVFFANGQFDAIRQRAKTDAHVRELVEIVLNDAKTTDDIGALAFAYYYNGDESCIARAHKQMMAKLDDPSWAPDDFTSTDLRTAAMCEQMAVSYSLFADLIPPEDRRLLALETWNRGIAPLIREWAAPGHKVHAFDTMGHNWWPVCVASGAFAGIVMQEDLAAYGVEDAAELVQMALSRKIQRLERYGVSQMLQASRWPKSKNQTFSNCVRMLQLISIIQRIRQ